VLNWTSPAETLKSERFRIVKNSTLPPPSRYQIRSVMNENKWVRLLAFITGMVNRASLLQCEYLVAENVLT
jgi:hypothetical protein